MARHETARLEVIEAAGQVGTGTPVGDWDHKQFIVTGIFAATLTVEGSLDGDNWFAVVSGITTPSAVPQNITQTVKEVRVRTTSYTSGTPVVIVAGHNLHTH